MKASYCFPSGNYNILLSHEELHQLLETGHVTIHMSRTPCTTSRAIFNDEKAEMEILDKKAVDNCVLFHTKEPVADIEAGDHYVQFLCINIEKQEDKNGAEKNQDGTDGQHELQGPSSL